MNFLEKGQINLSIVIAAWNGEQMLHNCLKSLVHQVISIYTEVIVVSNFETCIDKVSSEFSFAKIFISPPDTTVPELRAQGIFKAQGAIIALSEDLGVFDDKWCEELIKAHRSEHSIIGGAIENTSCQNLLDWAVYFYDYGRYMAPNQTRTVNTLSGLNVSYKREIILPIKHDYEKAFFESFIHETLKQGGYKLHLAPSVIFNHQKNYCLRAVIKLFYSQARSFAARRVFYLSISKRLLLAAAAVLLPFVLSYRTISQTIVKGRHFKKLIMSLPYLIFLMSVWSFGEFCGYLLGAGQNAHI